MDFEPVPQATPVLENLHTIYADYDMTDWFQLRAEVSGIPPSKRTLLDRVLLHTLQHGVPAMKNKRLFEKCMVSDQWVLQWHPNLVFSSYHIHILFYHTLILEDDNICDCTEAAIMLLELTGEYLSGPDERLLWDLLGDDVLEWDLQHQREFILPLVANNCYTGIALLHARWPVLLDLFVEGDGTLDAFVDALCAGVVRSRRTDTLLYLADNCPFLLWQCLQKEGKLHGALKTLPKHQMARLLAHNELAVLEPVFGDRDYWYAISETKPSCWTDDEREAVLHNIPRSIETAVQLRKPSVLARLLRGLYWPPGMPVDALETVMRSAMPLPLVQRAHDILQSTGQGLEAYPDYFAAQLQHAQCDTAVWMYGAFPCVRDLSKVGPVSWQAAQLLCEHNILVDSLSTVTRICQTSHWAGADLCRLSTASAQKLTNGCPDNAILLYVAYSRTGPVLVETFLQIPETDARALARLVIERRDWATLGYLVRHCAMRFAPIAQAFICHGPTTVPPKELMPYCDLEDWGRALARAYLRYATHHAGAYQRLQVAAQMWDFDDNDADLLLDEVLKDDVCMSDGECLACGW
jgi:hypothetical protein